jgi:membrane associated rhomboid family serine protease
MTFVFSWGYRPAERSSSLHRPMFLHGGFAHLFGNMPFPIYGDNVEHGLEGATSSGTS